MSAPHMMCSWCLISQTTSQWLEPTKTGRQGSLSLSSHYNVVAQILADAANTALGSVINKYTQIVVRDTVPIRRGTTWSAG